MLMIVPPLRGADSWGSGAYGAPRGARTHKGVDLACPARSTILCPVGGIVTKIGYPYADDLTFRYVEVRMDNGGYRVRLFYVKPKTQLGRRVAPGETLGVSQTLQKRYPGITDHVHLEIITREGEYIDPARVLA